MRGPFTSVICRLAVSTTVTIFGLMAVSSAKAQTKPKVNVNVSGPDIALTQPTALKTGDNEFEVIVKGAGGAPVNDAAVSVVMVMSRTATNGWMYKEVKLRPAGNGMYMGSGRVASRGKWETTVKVRKDGKKIGQKKVILTAP